MENIRKYNLRNEDLINLKKWYKKSQSLLNKTNQAKYELLNVDFSDYCSMNDTVLVLYNDNKLLFNCKSNNNLGYFKYQKYKLLIKITQLDFFKNLTEISLKVNYDESINFKKKTCNAVVKTESFSEDTVDKLKKFMDSLSSEKASKTIENILCNSKRKL